MATYSKEELTAIYELGRLYYEMGYFVPAERIFAGLCAVDSGQTAARLALGIVKLECGLFADSLVHLRHANQEPQYEMPAKLALSAAFVGMKELMRAQSMLAEIKKKFGKQLDGNRAAAALWEALNSRATQ